MRMVVAYDIANDRRRVRVHTFLLGFCNPVQESVFECEVDEGQASVLKRGVGRLARRPADRVRYYRLCSDCTVSIEDLDGPVTTEEPPLLWV